MFENVTVREWMTSPALTVLPGTPLSVAHEIMREHGVRRLIVSEDNHIMGIITIGDVREASPSDATTLSIWELNYLWSQLTVGHVMTHATITVGPNDSVVEAVKQMLDHKVSGLPVVDNKGTLLGVISEADIFRLIVQSHPSTEETMPA